MGKTGVKFCFYKKKEYDKLTKEQKDELWEYQEKMDGGDDSIGLIQALMIFELRQ